MKYCSKCKMVFFTEENTCDNGHKLASKLDLDSPVALISASGDKKRGVEYALIKAEIPYSEQDNSGYSPSVGKIEGDTTFLIPLSFLKNALDVLAENDILQRPEWYEKLDLPDEPEWEEMSKGKQTLVRAVSFAAFLVIIWLCVAGVDLLANWFTNLF